MPLGGGTLLLETRDGLSFQSKDKAGSGTMTVLRRVPGILAKSLGYSADELIRNQYCYTYSHPAKRPSSSCTRLQAAVFAVCAIE